MLRKRVSDTEEVWITISLNVLWVSLVKIIQIMTVLAHSERTDSQEKKMELQAIKAHIPEIIYQVIYGEIYKIALRSPPAEAMAWSENMDTLLANQAGLDAFRTFLKSEFSEENVEFWLACEDFKKTESAEKIASKAQMIYSEFIVADAPKEINIDFSTRDLISQNIAAPTIKCFDEAQKLVYSLMAKDSFPRFLKSEIYKKLINRQQVGSHKRWLPFL